ncbi:MAG: PqqD family protein, partial [Pseudomonadota bacterium]
MPKIAPHIAWNPVEGELALFDSRDGRYHALNGPGAAIWRAIAAGLDEEAIVDALAASHDAPRETIAGHVREF